MRKGRDFLLSIQRPDGSWYGSWAICFTYGTWFGVKGLLATGSSYDSCPALRRAVAFLLSKQMPSGGWGESYLSSQTKKYVQLEGSKPHVVNTAWAVLALVASGQAARDAEPLHKAARSLMRMQCSDGDWPQQTIMGVFNNNCMITYANYRNIFPLWALGDYARAVHGSAVTPKQRKTPLQPRVEEVESLSIGSGRGAGGAGGVLPVKSSSSKSSSSSLSTPSPRVSSEGVSAVPVVEMPAPEEEGGATVGGSGGGKKKAKAKGKKK